MQQEPIDQRALVVMAHPDDVDFASSGTVAQWTAAGTAVTYCLITDGDAGGFDPAVPRSEIAGIRQAEQRAAAAEVGVSELVFLGYPDGRLEVTMELRRDLSRVIRQVRPQRMIVMPSVRTYDRMPANHPDHLAAGEAAMCAIYPDARNPFTFPELVAEGHEAWTVAETWIQAPSGATHWVDVTDVWDRKMAALRAHVSQTAHMDGLDAMMRGWGGSNAAEGGLPEGRLAESYRVMDTR